MKGKVQTVLGLVDPGSLGQVLTHEHLVHELKKEVFQTPPPSWIPPEKFKKFGLENLGMIRQYPYSNDENMNFADSAVLEAVAQEMKYLKTTGSVTIVENSSIGLRAKQQANIMKNLSLESGIQIVSGTGYYVASSQTSETLHLSCEEMAKAMTTDITVGMDETDVKCGVIGEIGCSWPLHSFEKNVLSAAASVQQTLFCPVIIHPARHRHSPTEIMRCFLENGGNAKKTVMSHLDRTLLNEEDLTEFASSFGCISEFDLFGLEVSHYQLEENLDMPNDAQRISCIKYLIDQGFGDRIVISHDIHTKHRLEKFGGHGYSHIFMNVVPKMLKRGLSVEAVEKILVHNPRRWLTFE